MANLCVSNVYIAFDVGRGAGGLVGYNAGILRNVHVSGTIEGKNICPYAGGLVAYNSGTIANSSADVRVKACIAGGLAGGSGAGATISQKSYATGEVIVQEPISRHPRR